MPPVVVSDAVAGVPPILVVVALPPKPEVVEGPPPALVESVAGPVVPVDELVPPIPLVALVAPSVLSEPVPVLLVAPESTAPPPALDAVVPVLPGPTPEPVLVPLVFVETDASVEPLLGVTPLESEGPQAAPVARKPSVIQLSKTRTVLLLGYCPLAQTSYARNGSNPWEKVDEAMSCSRLSPNP